MKEFLTEMFAYERWANEQILDWLVAHPNHPDLVRVFAHLMGENLPWLCLLRGEAVPEEITPEPNWSLDECRRKLPMVMDALQSFVASATEEALQNVVASPTPAGVVFEYTTQQILANLLIHGEHHRGQIVGMIAEKTGQYVPSVYMSYLRRKPLVAVS